ncbi:LytR/AlgR family response regulator transcription factor [Mucilaginibacter myungsuensis]|uniref:Response regulator transcription factor n=1 Tax=Mucilaginibacter myungsuensis TaxID=649104 RepID=A0A929L1I1_9SPHI|nr:response regulator transcription factor [Mucilaginibacter myungsuensis]MBE9662774.1 response regulator transcription factor [Mucilaginibacter myungsuensis]MDN3598194.1 response regulator transcription factor [Mucilaginibacter myungsuensis]
MTLNCIIIEDEPLAMERLSDFVHKVPFLNLLRSFDNGLEAIGFVKTNEVDLLLLDIQMDGFTGIQLLESLPKRPEVIITTAFDQYALKGFDLNVTDYLLKPFTFERFMQAVTKVYDKLSLIGEREYKPRIFVKTEYRLEKVDLNDLLYIEGMRDYRCLQLPDRRILTLQTFTELEKELSPALFCRVHKSFIVSLNKIESVERDRIKIKDALIPISETFRENFYKRIR